MRIFINNCYTLHRTYHVIYHQQQTCADASGFSHTERKPYIFTLSLTRKEKQRNAIC